MLTQRAVIFTADEITIQQYTTTKALRYGTTIGKLAGAMLAAGLEGDLKEPDENDAVEGVVVEDDLLDKMNAGKMIEGLLTQVDDEATPELIKSMLKDAVVLYKWQGVMATKWSDEWFDDRFAGNLGDLFTLLMAIFEDNFGQAIALIKKKMPQGRRTSSRSSASTILDNGTGEQAEAASRAPVQESPSSFFDQ